ncbi:hypothetical protein EZMO1_4620 [Endozoicomonas montiporae CL-33]|nr:hypothetical protein EZMO1_4620 [Endozoicomonas montiporae CL-33]
MHSGLLLFEEKKKNNRKAPISEVSWVGHTLPARCSGFTLQNQARRENRFVNNTGDINPEAITDLYC